ncbi:hypothetical protein EVAR_91613_1 [Eumeta japonica]|uniref:Uncharacterized protein n=1 Tax=Eumeta variegata TaxID=151549 RepID=A0A4C1UY46_EUMVA|nr:hypothetical protein EVAR_91613_1 [Eumeta japonica]
MPLVCVLAICRSVKTREGKEKPTRRAREKWETDEDSCVAELANHAKTKIRILTEYGREVTASAVAFRPVRANSGGSPSPPTRPSNILFLPKRPTTQW